MKNIILAICTYKDNLNRAKHLEQVFRKYNFKNYFFYYGEGNYCDERFINLHTSDCYSNLTAKTYKMLDYFNNKDFDYLVKIDDDTFLDIDELYNLDVNNYEYIGGLSTLNDHLKNFKFYKDYLITRSLKKDINFDYTKKLSDFKYVMGNFCIFKKDIINKILQFCKNDTLHTEIPQEDISIGYICNRINAKILDISSHIPFYHITKNISYHPIPPMLHNLFVDASTRENRLSLCSRFLPANKYFKK